MLLGDVAACTVAQHCCKGNLILAQNGFLCADVL